MLIPAFVEPIFTLEQTISVSFKACGMDIISSRSPWVIPFCTNAEYPPIKLIPISLPALSSIFAYFTQSPPETLCSSAIGVTDTRWLIIGIPYSREISFATFTRSFAFVVIFLYIFSHERSISSSAQSNREIPIVTVRISRQSSSIM